MIFRTLAIALVASLASVVSASAADTETKARPLKHGHFHFEGIFGSYDADTLQRGFQVYREVCSSCHSMDLVSFRNLGQPGGPFYLASCPEGVAEGVDCSNPNDNPIVKAIAAEYTVIDGPDDEGDMFERPGTPADRIPGPYANSNQARAVNGGAYPPDMSLLAKARHHGPHYIYSLLTGYGEEVPEHFEIAAGQYYNPWFEGWKLSMAPPLSDGIVDYEQEDETFETVDQYAQDVSEFLMWAAEPKLEQRKSTGFMVVIYLLIFTGILYLSYKQVWRNVEH